jgi:hypothetical protein
VKEEGAIQLEKLSPRALETLRELSRTTGHESLERTVEELVFAMRELLQIIDTQKDPLLEPEATTRQMEIMRGVLQRFKRYEK